MTGYDRVWGKILITTARQSEKRSEGELSPFNAFCGTCNSRRPYSSIRRLLIVDDGGGWG
jgi:hypothetical protein